MKSNTKRVFCLLLTLILCLGLVPGVSAVEASTPETVPQTEETQAETIPPTTDSEPTETLPPETESTEPPPSDVPEDEAEIMETVGEPEMLPLASTQNSIMLFDYADNGNYTTVLNYQVSCAYKPNGSGTTRTAYIKNLYLQFCSNFLN